MELNPLFAVLAAVTLLGAIGAVALRNLVHCALCLTLALTGLAALYLRLGAEFIGFAQILVYVGAVAILIVFAILLTRSDEKAPGKSLVAPGAWLGVLIAVAVFLVLWAAVQNSGAVPKWGVLPPEISVKLIGEKLFKRPDGYVLPLLLTGVLLTLAMIGAVLIALDERRKK